MEEILKTSCSVRVFEDINNTLYKYTGGGIGIENTPSPIEEIDLVHVSDIHNTIDDQITVRGNPFIINERSVDYYSLTSRDAQSKGYQQLAGFSINPIERAGLRRISELVDQDGRHPRITLLSNMPLGARDLVLRRLEEDKVLPYLDPQLPILLRPYRDIHPALFKLEILRVFNFWGQRLYLVDDDYYIGDLIRRHLGIVVNNPLHPAVVARQRLAKRKEKDAFGNELEVPLDISLSGINYMYGAPHIFADLLRSGIFTSLNHQSSSRMTLPSEALP